MVSRFIIEAIVADNKQKGTDSDGDLVLPRKAETRLLLIGR